MYEYNPYLIMLTPIFMVAHFNHCAAVHTRLSSGSRLFQWLERNDVDASKSLSGQAKTLNNQWACHFHAPDFESSPKAPITNLSCFKASPASRRHVIRDGTNTTASDSGIEVDDEKPKSN